MKINQLTIILLAWVAAVSVAQDLTPRELFFAAPAIRQKAAGNPPGLAARKKFESTPADQPQNTSATTLGRPRNSPQIIPAAYVSNTPPLGLRYSLLLSRGNETYREVDSATTFKSGDRLKINVESNDEAYLYVIARGSSGLWKVLFPVTEVASGDNLIQPFRRYEVPNGGRFYFDDQAGEEKLFILLTRKPEENFEDLIYSINAPKLTPAKSNSVPAPRPAKTMQVAGLIRPIDDALVGKVRSELVARDLIFEKVDDSKPAPSAAPERMKETAVYVVNKSAGPNGKVMVDLKLEHK